MKRIIMFVLLFAALKVAGQTTGYLRFDTVKIMKQNGTCELYIINKTKDSLGLLTNVGGGLTRFIKSKTLNDSTIVIGLDTLVISGASGSGISGLTTGRVVIPASATTVTDDAELLYNPTSNKLTTDSARTIRVQSDTIISAVLPNYTGDSVYVLADSYGNAVGTTNSVYGWPTLLTGWMGALLRNFSVSASTLMKRTPVDPYGSSNLIDRLTQIPTFGAKKGWIVIAYGFNDMGQNSANYTPANFRLDYQTVMDDIISKGWPTHRIILVAPYYASAETYTTYATITGTPANTRQRHNAFIDTVQATATFNGTKFVNPMAAQLANDSTYLMADDFVHANNWGHAVIAQAIYSTITDTVLRNEQTLAINGKTELQNLYIKNLDTIPFTSAVLGLTTIGKVGMFNMNRLIKDQPLNIPQAANVNIIGKGLFGNVIAPTTAEIVQVNGMIKGSSLRATGSAPSGLTGSGNEISLVGGRGLFTAIDRDGFTRLPLVFNSYGDPGSSYVAFMTSSAPTGSEQFYAPVTAKFNVGQFSSTLPGGLTDPAVEIGLISSSIGYVGAYNRTASSPMILSLNGLGGNVIVGGYTDNSIGALQVNGKITIATADSSASPANMLWIDPFTNEIKKAAAVGGSDGNGIYSGSGSLPSDVTVSTAGNTLTISGSNDNETSFSVTNTGTTSASAIAGTASGTTSVGVTGTSTSYIGVFGNSTSNTGVQGQSSSGVGVIGVSSSGAGLRGQNNPSSTNAIENIVTLLRTSSSGAGANGIGSAIQYELETATNGNSQTAGSLAFQWTDATAATRTSQFEIYGVNSGTTARKAAVSGGGQWTWDTYGSGTHTGTPTGSLQVTSGGGVIEGPALASGTFTPTLTAVTNTSSPLLDGARYTRIGNIVTFSFRFSVTTSSGSSASSIRVTLPVASSFSNVNQAAGTCSGSLGRVEADAANDELIVAWTSGAGGTETIVVTGQYTIL